MKLKNKIAIKKIKIKYKIKIKSNLISRRFSQFLNTFTPNTLINQSISKSLFPTKSSKIQSIK
jgi:hypothetical protein